MVADKFKRIVVKSKTLRGLGVDLNWDCREGNEGDYDPEDPKDQPLLRFDVSYKGEAVEDGSYCTRLKATDTRSLLTKAAECILNEAEATLYIGEGGYLAQDGFKRRMEELSWLTIYKGKLR